MDVNENCYGGISGSPLDYHEQRNLTGRVLKAFDNYVATTLAGSANDTGERLSVEDARNLIDLWWRMHIAVAIGEDCECDPDLFVC